METNGGLGWFIEQECNLAMCEVDASTKIGNVNGLSRTWYKDHMALLLLLQHIVLCRHLTSNSLIKSSRIFTLAERANWPKEDFETQGHQHLAKDKGFTFSS